MIEKAIYEQASKNKLFDQTIEQRIIFYAHALLDTKYCLYDEIEETKKISSSYNYNSPIELLNNLLSTDEFFYSLEFLDCITYVETILALSYISNIKDFSSQDDYYKKFTQYLKSIRYYNSNTSFWNRNHFTAVEWIPNNQLLFSDITTSLYTQSSQASALFNRTGWLYKTKFETKFYNKLNFTEADLKTLIQEHNNGINNIHREYSIPYIKLEDLDHLDSEFSHWPDISIVNIVKPRWDLTSVIGTQLNISHLGFVVKENDQLNFLHATSIEPFRIVKLPLIEYLKRYKNHPTIKGINILTIKDNMTVHLNKNNKP